MGINNNIKFKENPYRKVNCGHTQSVGTIEIL